MASKIEILSLTVGDSFKYCGRQHRIISMTPDADGLVLTVATDRHPGFKFPTDQMVTEV